MVRPPTPSSEALLAQADPLDATWGAAVRALEPAVREALLRLADAAVHGEPADAERAHACYLALGPTLDPARPEDLPRIGALLVGGCGAAPSLAPLWRRVRASGEPRLAVQAADRLATIARRAGEHEEAEAQLRWALLNALPLGGRVAGDVLASCAADAIQDGREFEALAYVRRAAPLLDAGAPAWHRAFTAWIEARIATQLEDWPRQREATERFAALAADSTQLQRLRAAPDVADLEGQRALSLGDPAEALQAFERVEAGWAPFGGLSAEARLALEADRVRALVSAGRPGEADQRARLNLWSAAADDLRTVPLRLAALDAARALGAEPGALKGEAEALLTLLGSTPEDHRLRPAARRGLATRLATMLDGLPGCSPLARRAYDLAASFSLERLLEVERFCRELPELAQPADRDLALLNSYRARMHARHRALPAAVARHLAWALAEGHPVSAHLPCEDGLVPVCAWCQRLRIRGARWLTVQQFFPLAPARGLRVTHCICDRCADGVRRELTSLTGLPGTPAPGG